MSTQILTTPIQPLFAKLVAAARKDVFLAAPYVKASIASLILEQKQPSTKLSLLTAYRLPDFHRRASDVAALKDLLNAKATVRSCQTLHAKVYIFDSTTAIVTSANLTTGGLCRNIECGVLLDDGHIVATLQKTFSNLFIDPDDSWAVTPKILATTEAILARAPTIEQPPFEMTEKDLRSLGEESPTSLYEGGVDSIRLGLRTGWQRALFDILTRIPKQNFWLNDVYKHLDELAARYPRSSTIKESIRRNLQELRDHGLVEFMGNGYYRKLWK
jgi:hypothetical protein